MKTKLSVFCEKVIEAGWLAAVITVPLFFNIHSARTFEPDKLTLMRSLALFMALAWLIKVMEEGRIVQSDRSFQERFLAWVKQPLILPTLVLVIIYTISTILSISPNVSLWGSYQRLQGTYTTFSYILIFALMAANLKSQIQVERLLNTIILTSVPVSLYGIIQHNGLDPLPWQGDVTKRVASNMGNAIFVASYLIMIVPLTVSRLIRAMGAIVTEENSSWGQTILAAVYIFVLAIQVLTILYSGSRGPQIGMMGSFVLFGFLLLLILRQKSENRTPLSIREFGYGLALVIGLALGTGIAGLLGFLVGSLVDYLLALGRLQAEGIPLLGAALGGLIGFSGVYTYFAASGKGWRWLWVSWLGLGALGVAFIVALNLSGGPLEGLRQIPYLERLGDLTNAEDGSGKVRLLIWEGTYDLIMPHRPLGVEGEFTDGLNGLRPLIGFGPESMFNAFAFAYPNDLAHFEARGSSADRSHNETMDSLVITGILGFIAFHLLSMSVFYFFLRWLGWIPNRRAGYWLIGLMVGLGVVGILVPYFVQGSFNLSPIGLPFGIFAGLLIYLCIRAFLQQPDQDSLATTIHSPVLWTGLFAALIGHFLEVHFVFSIAATYTYFWVYLGLAFAMSKMAVTPEDMPISETAEVEEEEKSTSSSRKRRQKGRARAARRAQTSSGGLSIGSLESWLGSNGLVMAIIMIILIFDFVPVSFSLSTGRYSLLWMVSITFLVGLALTISEAETNPIFQSRSGNWGWGIALYLITSLGYTGFYVLLHGQQRSNVKQLVGQTNQAITLLQQAGDSLAFEQGLQTATAAAVRSAAGIFNIFMGFYIVLLILLLLVGFMLLQGAARRLTTWRTANWWLYPPLIAAVILAIFFKNINVVKADIFLKEGQKYKDANLWDVAIGVHEESVQADSDEDFYYLMLALNYQLKSQDGRMTPEQRDIAWQKGEEIALTAREINRYNPDNTGNMGRYYFTIAQLFDSAYYETASEFFQKAIQLAPQNVDYYNLVAQIYYIQQDYDQALIWYNKSATLDALYAPTWLYKGDTHMAKSEVEEAAEAHIHAIELNVGSFLDENYDTRLSFYMNNDHTEPILTALESYVEAHRTDARQDSVARALWGLGHAQLRMGNTEQANELIAEAISRGFNDSRALIEWGDTALTLGNLAEAETAYNRALEQNPNLPQVHSSLGYIYAQTGRLQDAIDANAAVLETMPNDYDSNKNLALLYQQAGEPEQAMAYARVALEVAPENNRADIETFIDQLSNQIQGDPEVGSESAPAPETSSD